MPAFGSDTTSEDPLVAAHFEVQIEDKITGYFTEVSGLGSENEIAEHKVMGPGGIEVVKKIPGRLKWDNIVLKRGITSNMDLWTWRREVEDGNVESARTNGSITMLDQTGAEVARWNFERGWPTKISGPSPKSDGNDIAVEELTIAHEFIERVL
jgi:phage tail-like protein